MSFIVKDNAQIRTLVWPLLELFEQILDCLAPLTSRSLGLTPTGDLERLEREGSMTEGGCLEPCSLDNTPFSQART